ncbi:Flavin carrier protein 2 [Neonectria ditissima]|uniref:Flavin carrier protein 2 n=1 Tax=Neonectria ditissima TaxID=78410 RepID=A0A0P7C305_9HYPO|nr:Flavin carrier protein 2 [Neonectria ditissima]
MRFSFAAVLATLCFFSSVLPSVTADRILESNSLNSCQDESAFSASLFNMVITPNNSMVTCRVIATVSVQGSIVFDVALNIYGYQYMTKVINPCSEEYKLPGLCPMSPGNIDSTFSFPLGDALDSVPGIAYTIPDLDAMVRVFVNLTDTQESVACVEAAFSTGKTVESVGVKWATAVIAGLGLVSAAVVSALGHSNAAAHLAVNAMSLFGYFQAQAIIGLTGIKMPPIVQAWTQNFQWSMGIIQVDWMQDIFTWYQRATGGTPATLLSSLTTSSVQVAKRSLEFIPEGASYLVDRGVAMMSKRNNVKLDNGSYIVYGIQRVAYRSKIETTNLFLTGLVIYYFFVLLTIAIVSLFKVVCELCIKQGWLKGDKFIEFRSGWLTILKGILFRLTLIGFPQMTILCLWEFTQVDSPALVILAVIFFFGMLITLGWATFQVIRLARSENNPAYVLFSSPQVLNRLGFLYVQFRASAYYFIIPILFYTIIKGMFIAFGQHNGVVQAVALIIIEVAALIASSVLRPWMDKPTNSFNIAIHVLNFLNAIFLLIFTNVFGAPNMAAAIVGIVLFIANATFSLVLLLMVIISSALVFWRRNPDARYRFMADDRTSFMKSQTQLDNTNELDALAATARGDKASYGSHTDFHQDDDSFYSDSISHQPNPDHHNNGTLAAASRSQVSLDHARSRQAPRSPVNPSLPLFPAEGQRLAPNPR